jgi:ATPase subunit of ABC transporter with duplicated ATPase domains
MDIEQVARFEAFVRDELHAAALIVSHDRALLDAATTKTLFLRDQRIYAFDLPFSEARTALREHDDAARTRRADEEKELERLRISASRLAEWGKLYSNEKFSQRARSMQRRIDRLEEEKTFIPRAVKANVRLDTEATSSPCVLDVRDLTVATTQGRELFSVEQLTLRRGERLAIVGRNGCGKSTFLRSVMAQLRAGTRSREIGFNPATRFGYYDQELKHFSDTERVAEAVADRCEMSRQRLTAELVNAGFAYERHASLVSSLSGGERARLTFLILTLSQPNLLVLDEPTNHLDVEGIEQLEHTLVEGEGSVLFVSHDRRFVERVATRVVELPLEVRGCGGRLKKK